MNEKYLGSTITFNGIEFFPIMASKEYMISKCGLVLSLPKFRCAGNVINSSYIILQPQPYKSPNKKRNYKRVLLNVGGKYKSFPIHRLLAETFICNPNNYKFVVFKDLNTFNYSLDNLEFSPQPNKYASSGKSDFNMYGKGITYREKNTTNHFSVRIMVDGKRKEIGCYKTIEEAQNAYNMAKQNVK